MSDHTFEVEVTAERLEAARPFLAEVLYRRSRACFRHPVAAWLVAITAAVVWWFLLPWLLPDVGPKTYYTILAVVIVIQVVAVVGTLRLAPVRFDRAIARWSAGVTIRRTKKRAPFTVRYRVGDRDYRAEIDKFGIVRNVQIREIAAAYRTSEVVILYRRRWSPRPRAFIYLADDEHRRAMDRLLEAGAVVVHDLSDGRAGPPAQPSSEIRMSNAAYGNEPYRNEPFGPTYVEPPRGNGCGRVALGCGMVVSVVLILLAAAIYLITPAFVGYMIQDDLADWRDAIELANLNPKDRDEVSQGLEAVRLSLDDRQDLGFFQWMTISQEFRQTFEDGQVDDRELAKLKTEVGRLKKIQGIEGK